MQKQILNSLDIKLLFDKQKIVNLSLESDAYFEIIDEYPILQDTLEKYYLEILVELNKVKIRVSVFERTISILQKESIF